MDNENWRTTWKHELGTSGLFSVHVAITDVNTRSTFRLTFWTDLHITRDEVCTGHCKAAHIDNVVVSGTPVPEPRTLLLFGTDLAGLAAVSKKRDSPP